MGEKGTLNTSGDRPTGCEEWKLGWWKPGSVGSGRLPDKKSSREIRFSLRLATLCVRFLKGHSVGDEWCQVEILLGRTQGTNAVQPCLESASTLKVEKRRPLANWTCHDCEPSTVSLRLVGRGTGPRASLDRPERNSGSKSHVGTWGTRGVTTTLCVSLKNLIGGRKELLSSRGFPRCEDNTIFAAVRGQFVEVRERTRWNSPRKFVWKLSDYSHRWVLFMP